MLTTKTYTCITGASSGIGRAAAKKFAEQGHNLIIIARRKQLLEELAHELMRQFPDIDVVIKTTDLSVSQNALTLYNELHGYHITTWINNAGFGNYASVAEQDLTKISKLLHLNIETLTLLSSLYVKDYHNQAGAQLINISSRGGYTIGPNDITYCASKFYVSAFTEGLAQELRSGGVPLQAKVLAPAATKTEFGKHATDQQTYDYDSHFATYHTSEEMADFLMQLHASSCTTGLVNTDDFSFALSGPLLPSAF